MLRLLTSCFALLIGQNSIGYKCVSSPRKFELYSKLLKNELTKLKKSKIGYELFKRKTRENIIDIYKCFCNLVNDFRGLGILDNQIGDKDFEIIVGSMNNESHNN